MKLFILRFDLQGVADKATSFKEAKSDHRVNYGIKPNKLGGAHHPFEDASCDSVFSNQFNPEQKK